MPCLPLDPARDEIRVLRIVASDDSSELVECSLKQVSLRNFVPYMQIISLGRLLRIVDLGPPDLVPPNPPGKL